MRHAPLRLALLFAASSVATAQEAEPAAAEADASELSYTISGMSCQSCRVTIEEAVSALEGVQSASLDFGARRLTVRFSGDTDAMSETLIATVEELGYGIEAAAAE